MCEWQEQEVAGQTKPERPALPTKSVLSVFVQRWAKIHYVKTHFLHKKTKQEPFKEGRENGEYCTLKIDSAPKSNELERNEAEGC